MSIDVYKEWLGIPDGPRPPDHYELLRCVRFEDDAEKIRSFQRKLSAHVRKYATGKYMQESQDLLNELAKAMLCLTDPVRKRDYDESLGANSMRSWTSSAASLYWMSLSAAGRSRASRSARLRTLRALGGLASVMLPCR